MPQVITETRSRPRGKPLRTYGKRAATADPRNESLSKKRRTQDGDLQPEREDSNSANEGSPPQTKLASATLAIRSAPDAPMSQGKPEVKKGSIMNFFKPIPQPSSTVSSPQPEEAEDQSTPPSSPPLSRAEMKRKPRILRFRGSSLPILETKDTTDEKDENKEEESKGGDTKATNNEAARADKTKKPKNKAPTVQTTLNISSQAAFSECKICDTVWNPLYPDDVKYHKKQHAAVLRAKKKLEENEL